MIKNTFTNIGDHLLMCNGVVSKDGDVIKVTAADKLILAFMHHRWLYFTIEKKSEYWDSQQYIALRTGNNVKTVERCIAKMTKAGVVIAEKRFDKKKKHNKWFWLSFADVKYVVLDGDKIKEFVKEDMGEYRPSPHYKAEVDLEAPDYVAMAPDDFDMLVPYSDYNNDEVMSMVYGG